MLDYAHDLAALAATGDAEAAANLTGGSAGLGYDLDMPVLLTVCQQAADFD